MVLFERLGVTVEREQIKSARYTGYRNAFYHLVSILFSNLIYHQSFIPHLTPTSTFHLYTHTHTHTHTDTHTHTHIYMQTVAIVVSCSKTFVVPKIYHHCNPWEFSIVHSLPRNGFLIYCLAISAQSSVLS